MKNTLKTFSIAILGGLVAFGMMEFFNPKKEEVAEQAVRIERIPVQVTGMNESLPMSEWVSFNHAAEQTVDAVVHVFTEYTVTAGYDPFADFFGRSQPQKRAQGAGSGVIISDDGYIVTNNHVINGADNIQVNTSDNRTFSAEVIGTDPSTDIALIKIDAADLDFIDFGNSDDVAVGDWVLAVGNPFNLASTVTAGIVSAKARNINLLRTRGTQFPIESFIQTDAAVNPGNSGGALVDLDGKLIGINTAIASRSGSFSGYSFAVPSSIVQKVTNDLLEYGEVQRALIGVMIQDINQELANELELNEVKGVLVTGLSPNGAAQASGIEENDVIVGVNDVQTNNVPELQEQIGRYRPGDEVLVKVVRDGDEQIIPVELRNKAGNTKIYKASEYTAQNLLQAELRPINYKEMRAMGLRNGVMITELNGDKLRTLGIDEGFIITHIDRTPVENPEDISRILSQSEGGVLLSGVYPNGQKAYYGLGV
jgi:serine protease Do